MEGIPVSIMEAFASGLAVVATEISGIPELVRPGVTGYLIPPADPPALADAMSNVYMDPIGVARMVKAGQALVTKEFNIEHSARQLSALFEQFLCQARVPDVGRTFEVHPTCR
jgi:glycosyltransferase involved in cell wall biosynthesis